MSQATTRFQSARVDLQGSVEAPDGSAVFNKIGQHREPQMRVALGRADQRHASGGGADPFGGALDQQGTFDRQQRLVASHAGAAAAGEDESRVESMRRW